MTTFGIDIASWQKGLNIDRVAAEGFRYVIAKATESNDYRNPEYAAQKAGARKNGLHFGAYHYLRADKSAKAQVDNYAALEPDKSIPVMLDQEEVGLMFQKYNLISAAVVDENDRLVGQMTVDDVVHIISEEAGEDALLMSGAGDGDINEPIREAYSARVRWLIANLGTALVASLIIAMFGAAIEQLVALAVLMPIVASIGGNAGTQTMAVTVRAIATNQLTRSNTRRILLREMRVAVLNGMTIAVLIGLATGVIFSPMLGGVIALAMVINVVIAGLAGVLVPVIFDRLDQDPAVASSVFVTMITDSMGFFAFLGLAVASGIVGS